jgi:hypothetical protein
MWIIAGWFGSAPASNEPVKSGKEDPMLWTIAVILVILWLLGLVSSYTMGGFIHILLVLAIIVVLLNIFQGRGRS